MSNPAIKNALLPFFIIFFILGASFFSVFAQYEGEEAPAKGPFGTDELLQQKGLSVLMQQAREYRLKGLSLQRVGDLNGALSWYQKAVEIDPGFAVAFNDLGVVYETQGFIDRAQDSYMRSTTLDPYYVSPPFYLGVERG